MKNVVKSLLLIALLIIVAFAITGCGKENNEPKEATIVGSWKYDGADYTYTFNEDGTGKYNAAGTDMEFTYTINENQISILYTGNTAPFETEFSINGDTLNIIDSFGSDTLYKKVK